REMGHLPRALSPRPHRGRTLFVRSEGGRLRGRYAVTCPSRRLTSARRSAAGSLGSPDDALKADEPHVARRRTLQARRTARRRRRCRVSVPLAATVRPRRPPAVAAPFPARRKPRYPRSIQTSGDPSYLVVEPSCARVGAPHFNVRCTYVAGTVVECLRLS